LNFETFLYESADNGANFTLLSSLSITDNMNAVYSFNPLMLTGNNNDTGAPYILVSLDDGLTFTEANINDNGINVIWESFENFSQAGSTLFAHSTQGYLVSSDNGSNWDYTEFDNGELSNIVGWDGRWLRFSRPFGFQYNIEISTDDGETWTTFFDGIEGFPNVSGPSGLWMEDGVIYSQNHVGNAPNGGMFIKLEESDSEWQYMTDVDALPYNISSFAIENNEIFVGVPDLGVWSNSSDIPDFIEDSSFSAFAMVPNPASEEVSFLGLDGSLEVSVYTSTGQLLRTEKLEHTKMNIADLPSGCYLLTVSSGNQVKRVQLLKN
ncbi:MAG: T9SS type A sorting domain-containing protein, partial [Flavobacteriales bacterium]